MIRETTICALSTPVGTGGLAVIRLSGPEAFAICQKLLPKRGVKGRLLSLAERPSHRAFFSRISDPVSGQLLDEGMILPMKGPHTFTGEDTVEIDCHGGMYICRRILEALIASGAHMADPGEFTKRAFLNGKLDLSQAEAVMDMIDAGTRYSLKAASSQLSGKLSRETDALREELLSILVDVEVNIDYPEYDDLPEISDEDLQVRAKSVLDRIEALLSTADSGIRLREGLSTAIIGLPNVGKSSLLNRLLGEERAIVTDIPGTTRDVVSEMADLGGIPVRLIDTAGIRQTEDLVESLGVQRSYEAIRKSDLVLFISDHPKITLGEMSEEEKELLRLIDQKPFLLLINKADLREDAALEAADNSAWPEDLPRPGKVLSISARTGEGLEETAIYIKEAFFSGEVLTKEGPLVTNLRQKEALLRAKEALTRVQAGAGLPQDLLSIDLSEAADALGEVTGKSARQDVVDQIFARFCLGK